MFERHQYYALIASLPRLVRFDQAERLPINLERLRERLTMLAPDDAELVARVASLIVWQRQPMERSDEEMIADYRRFAELIDNPLVYEMVELRIDIRTVVAALRRRKLGMPAPKAGEKWGVGKWARHIEQNWDDPNFKLSSVYPWIHQVREHIEKDEALELERLLMSKVWDGADRLKEDVFFGFDVVLAYLFKWDMQQRWLSYDEEGARVRFDELLAEALNEHEINFD